MPRTWKSARGVPALRAGRTEWYTIKNLATGGSDIAIYDEIGYVGVTAQDFIADLAAAADPITLRLHTPGGEVFDGIAIYNALRQRGNVRVRIEGLAASIGSVIAMAAAPGQLEIARRARMMIHDGFSMAVGNAADMRALADQLDAESDNIAGIYSDRTGQPAARWRELMRAETWYDGQQAVDAGLADRVIEDGARPASNFDLSVFRNAVTVRPAGDPADLRVPVVLAADGNHAPMTGSHSHMHPAYGSQGGDSMHSHEHSHDGDANHGHHRADGSQDGSGGMGNLWTCEFGHPAHPRNADGQPEQLGDGWVRDPDGTVRFDPDGDGDDDSTPEGDTDHDYFDEQGRPIKPVPPCPGMHDAWRGALRNADVDNSPWDADRAWHNGAASDDPAKFYAGICAGKKAGDKATQDAWALPYRYTPSSPPNAAGVRNALSRLPQTDGLTNKAEAQALLERLMKQINPDHEPGDRIDPHLLRAVFASGLEGGQ